MPTKAKQYVGLVIGAGMFVFAASFAGGTLPDLKRFLMYLALAVLASLLKVRLPGITGSYSLNFLFLLAGVAYFTLPETLVAGCAAALAQSVFNTRKRPTAAQVLFNMANLVLSIRVCFHVAHGPLAHGLESYRPAVMALVAGLYFVINTVLVSGVLSILEGKSLREVCQKWYLWSIPYYLVGATLIGRLPSAVHPATPESWLMMLPALYLIHFYYGLSKGTYSGNDCSEAEQCEPSLNVGAKLYLALITASGMLLLTFAGLYWHSDDRARFVGYLVVPFWLLPARSICLA